MKVIDFGISKIEVGSILETIKIPYSTIAYMAPKILIIKSQIISMYYFKANIYSFIIVFCKILSKQDLLHSIYTMDKILERMKKDMPKLP